MTNTNKEENFILKQDFEKIFNNYPIEKQEIDQHWKR